MMDLLLHNLRTIGTHHCDGTVGEEAADEIERLRRVLHEIAEEWAGAECGEPVTAQEAYAIALARRMYKMATAGLTP